MSATPEDLLESVTDEESFIRFVVALRTDWEQAQADERIQVSSTTGPGARGWRHFNIGPFLQASVAWAEVADHRIWGYTKSQNPWRRAADILMAGKVYEHVGA